MVPSPSLLTWWSIQITVPARAATGASCPNRSIEALSSVTSTAGSFGKAFGSTRPSVPGSAFTHGASFDGTLTMSAVAFIRSSRSSIHCRTEYWTSSPTLYRRIPCWPL